MRVGGLFSGVGGFELAAHRAGMETAWWCEVDKHCRKVMRRHFGEAKAYGDIRKLTGRDAPHADLICGGFPCQDVSLAGGRAGLAGERSGLWFEFRRVLEEYRPRWCVLENVPGLLSSNGGRDFAIVLHGLGELGYLSAWRVLNARYFGVPQRRRRVFVVGHLGDGRAAEVLYEQEGQGWYPSEGEEEEGGTSIASEEGADGVTLIVPGHDVVPPVAARDAKGVSSNNDQHPLIVVCYENHGQDSRVKVIDKPALHAKAGTGGNNLPLIGFYSNQGALGVEGHGALPPVTNNCAHAVAYGEARYAVRKMMPVECERAQGFPDGWTDGESDSQRYKMLGNAVCVPVAEWIFRRIKGADDAR